MNVRDAIQSHNMEDASMPKASWNNQVLATSDNTKGEA
jgi:hypothetical protein